MTIKNTPVYCRTCHKWFSPRYMRCLVRHVDGKCCHAYQIEVEAPSGDK